MCTFWDTLPDSIANEIRPSFCGMILQFQLLGRAKVLGDALDDGALCTENAVGAIVDAIYERDFFATGNAAYLDYYKLLSTRINSHKTYSI